MLWGAGWYILRIASTGYRDRQNWSRVLKVEEGLEIRYKSAITLLDLHLTFPSTPRPQKKEHWISGAAKPEGLRLESMRHTGRGDWVSIYLQNERGTSLLAPSNPAAPWGSPLGNVPQYFFVSWPSGVDAKGPLISAHTCTCKLTLAHTHTPKYEWSVKGH